MAQCTRWRLICQKCPEMVSNKKYIQKKHRKGILFHILDIIMCIYEARSKQHWIKMLPMLRAFIQFYYSFSVFWNFFAQIMIALHCAIGVLFGILALNSPFKKYFNQATIIRVDCLIVNGNPVASCEVPDLCWMTWWKPVLASDQTKKYVS